MENAGWRRAAGIASVLLPFLFGSCEERGKVEAPATVREPLAVQISGEFDIERYPELFPSGGPYRLTCGSLRCVAFYKVDAHVYAARIDQTGHLDSHPVWVGTGGAPIAAAAKNDDFMVVWGDDGARRATRIRGGDGQTTDLTSQLPSSSGDYDVGSDGNSWLVLHYGQTVRAIVKAADTFASIGTPVQVSSDVSRPTIVPGDGQYLLLGNRSATRVSAATGALLDPTPIEFSKYGTLSNEPGAAYEDGVYVLTWAGSDSVFVSRIRASDGVRLDPDDDFNQVSGAKVICSGQTGARRPFALALANTVLVLWTKESPQTLEGQAARVDPATGARVSGATNAPEITVPYWLAWGFFHSGSWGMLNTSTGVRPVQIQDAPLAITPGAETLPVVFEIEARSLPSVASNGSSFFVAWRQEDHLGTSDSFRIFGSRVSAGGQYLDDPPLAFGPGYMVAVASRGPDYLVAYPAAGGIQRRFVSASGQVGAPLPAIPEDTANLRLAHDNRNFLLAWESRTGTTIGLRAARLDANGAVIDTAALPLTTATQSVVSFFAVADTAPAENQRTFTVLYDTLSSPRSTLARLVRSESGVLVQPFTNLTPGSLQAAASDGNRTLVVFMGNTLSAGLSNPLTGPFDGPAVPLSAIPNSASVAGVHAWYDGKSYLLGLRTRNGDNRTSALAVRRYSAALAHLDSAVPGTGAVAVPAWSNTYPSAAVVGDGAGRSLLVYVQDDTLRLGSSLKARFIVNDGLPADGGGGLGGTAGSTGTGGNGGTGGSGGSGGTGGNGGTGGSAGSAGIGGTEGSGGSSGTGDGGTGGTAADGSVDAAGGVGAADGSLGTAGTPTDAASSTGGTQGIAGSGSGGRSAMGSGGTAGNGRGGSSPRVDAGRLPSTPSDEGGCGCRASKRPPLDVPLLALLGCAVVLIRRRGSRRP